MKKTIVLLLLILLIVALIISTRFKIIRADSNYIIKDEQGNIVDAKIYKDEDELILSFKEIERLYIIIPSNNIIGIMEVSSNDYYKIWNIIFLDRDKEYYTSLNEGFYKSDFLGIQKYNFEDKKIVFSTNEEIKHLGEKIIITW